MKLAQKIVLLAIAVYHMAFALMTIVSDEMAATVAKHVFGVTLDMSPQVMYMVKVLGVYGAVFGVFVLVVALNAARYASLIYIVMGLYIARIATRLIFLPGVSESFKIAQPRIFIGAGLLAAFALAVTFVRPKRTS
jgi:hypothetical protein